MKSWIIRQTDAKDIYFIPTKKSIWITEENKGVAIEKLIADKKLSLVKTINYEELRRIFFIETSHELSFEYKDEKAEADAFEVEPPVFHEILRYFKSHLKGTEIKKFTALQQVIPHLSVFVIATILIASSFVVAMKLERGESVDVSGRRGGFKEIIIKIADLLGTTGTLIAGALILGIILYTIYRDLQNPKKGEILVIKKFPQLSI